MTIKASANSITIDGNIKSISDFQEIKSTIDDLASANKSITINVLNSLSITSSVIGYLNKLVKKDNITIHLNVGNEQLFELLSDLNLTSVFNTKVI
jgi:hypothetical protein